MGVISYTQMNASFSRVKSENIPAAWRAAPESHSPHLKPT
jgi:hypothetical protein